MCFLPRDHLHDAEQPHTCDGMVGQEMGKLWHRFLTLRVSDHHAPTIPHVDQACEHHQRHYHGPAEACRCKCGRAGESRLLEFEPQTGIGLRSPCEGVSDCLCVEVARHSMASANQKMTTGIVPGCCGGAGAGEGRLSFTAWKRGASFSLSNSGDFNSAEVECEKREQRYYA